MRKIILAWSAILATTLLQGQVVVSDSINPTITNKLSVESGLIPAFNNGVPFWVRYNNSGRFKDSNANSLFADILYEGSTDLNKNWSLSWEMESVLSFNGQPDGTLIQANLKIENSFIKIFGGMEEEFFGFNDPQLSLGNLGYGNNALPIPKIVIATNGWQRTPILGDVLSFKAYLAHGWFEKNRFQSQAFLHQKYLYLKANMIGKRLELAVGLNHNAQWGGSNRANESAQPTGFKNFTRLFLARAGGPDALLTDRQNALGNHLGNYDLRGSYQFNGFKISNYWQFLWEDGGGLVPFNWRDGMMGVSVTFDNFKLINKFVFEIVRTNDQDARKMGKDGVPIFEPDNFFNNSVYKSGWTYKNNMIGSPLFININSENAQIANIQNMVNAFHIALAGEYKNFDYMLRFTSFQNNGTKSEPLDPSYALDIVDIMVNYRLDDHSGFNLRLNYEVGNLVGGSSLGFLLSFSSDVEGIRKILSKDK